MYRPIRTCLLRRFRSSGYTNVHLEITSDGSFSTKLKKALGTRVVFLGRHFAPDLCGFLEEQDRLQLISVEVKRKKISFREIFQAKGYGELIDAKYAFLVSNKLLVSAIRDFLRNKESILYFGYPETRIMYIGRFNLKTNRMVEEDWFPKSPF